MAKEISYVFINPCSILKSRTGGILSRLMGRTGLDLVEACLFAPDRELAEAYARDLREHGDDDGACRDILSDYVLRAYVPGPGGERRRVILLLFEGEDAVGKVYEATGPLRPGTESGETVRDTYGDLIMDSSGSIVYVEPAVLVAHNRESVKRTVRLWASSSRSDSGLLSHIHREPAEPGLQRTLVLIKCDTLRFPGSRPGQIIDLLSRSGLRITGIKVHYMSCAQALAFYQPLRETPGSEMKAGLARDLQLAVSERLGIDLPHELLAEFSEKIAPVYCEQKFQQLVGSVTGVRPDQCGSDEWDQPGKEKSLALVYEGSGAVEKIHAILGPKDFALAGPGTVSRELGAGMMLYAAHASESPESAEREISIIGFRPYAPSERIEKYLH